MIKPKLFHGMSKFKMANIFKTSLQNPTLPEIAKNNTKNIETSLKNVISLGSYLYFGQFLAFFVKCGPGFQTVLKISAKRQKKPQKINKLSRNAKHYQKSLKKGRNKKSSAKNGPYMSR